MGLAVCTLGKLCKTLAVGSGGDFEVVQACDEGS